MSQLYTDDWEARFIDRGNLPQLQKQQIFAPAPLLKDAVSICGKKGGKAPQVRLLLLAIITR